MCRYCGVPRKGHTCPLKKQSTSDKKQRDAAPSTSRPTEIMACVEVLQKVIKDIPDKKERRKLRPLVEKYERKLSQVDRTVQENARLLHDRRRALAKLAHEREDFLEAQTRKIRLDTEIQELEYQVAKRKALATNRELAEDFLTTLRKQSSER